MSTANAAVQGIIAYQFNDLSLLTEALQAPGVYTGTRVTPDGHKRMALLGDTVMKLALLDHWYGGGGSRGNSSPVRYLRLARAKLLLGTGDSLIQSQLSNSNLGIIGRQHGLEAHINNNPSQLGVVSDKTLATTVEAILGAVYLDCGKELENVKSVMRIFGLGPV